MSEKSILRIACPCQFPPFLAFPYRHRRVNVCVVHPDLSGKHPVSGVFRNSLHLPLPQKGGLPEKVRPQFAHAHLWRPCSLPNFFRHLPWQYGHSPKKVLDLLRRSKTWSLKHIGMAPFWKFQSRPQGKVAISSCGWPWNSCDIVER